MGRLLPDAGTDVTAVAVPIVGHDREIVAAISINAPSYRTTDSDVERFGAALIRHAVAVSLALGAPAYLVGQAGHAEGRPNKGDLLST
jgi:hypothetical protein